jgi:hypothetical protein
MLAMSFFKGLTQGAHQKSATLPCFDTTVRHHISPLWHLLSCAVPPVRHQSSSFAKRFGHMLSTHNCQMSCSSDPNVLFPNISHLVASSPRTRMHRAPWGFLDLKSEAEAHRRIASVCRLRCDLRARCQGLAENMGSLEQEGLSGRLQAHLDLADMKS